LVVVLIIVFIILTFIILSLNRLISFRNGRNVVVQEREEKTSFNL
jgi:hypothetical protein